MSYSVKFVVLCGLVCGAFASEEQSRGFKDIVYGTKDSSTLTKATIDSSLSILGVLVFAVAFVLIPLLSLLYTGGSWVPTAASRSLKKINKNGHLSRVTRAIIDNDRCIERIVCELSRGARYSRADRWTDAIFNSVPAEGKFMKRVSDVYKARQATCDTYTCEPIGFIARTIIYVLDWNTILKA